MYAKLYFTSNDVQVEPVEDSVGEPVSYILRADLNQVGDWTGLYALATSGYVCSGVEISLDGSTYLKWQLNADDGGGDSPSGTPEDYGDSLNIGEVGATKVYFHIRAKATQDESVGADKSVNIKLYGIASAE